MHNAVSNDLATHWGALSPKFPGGGVDGQIVTSGGGPGNHPSITWDIVNGAAGDDLIITALSLSAISFKILNTGNRLGDRMVLAIGRFRRHQCVE
jgi:hypothetical protein